eukprot:246038-Rhodomonas_salina.1
MCPSQSSFLPVNVVHRDVTLSRTCRARAGLSFSWYFLRSSFHRSVLHSSEFSSTFPKISGRASTTAKTRVE